MIPSFSIFDACSFASTSTRVAATAVLRIAPASSGDANISALVGDAFGLTAFVDRELPAQLIRQADAVP
ncbi:MAG: hypothetical protein ACJAVR_003445 [Paracoccaceae bacterium]|jgi:hypothetical protein